jgi:hypothetical protein
MRNKIAVAIVRDGDTLACSGFAPRRDLAPLM